ncbi:astacin-like metalloprotease toxin 5 [Centruroides sculpturatus]|uniref:astacin-like metalloprotease toxin 5 n=2 Tax=Centruroides sculpturatus TaxID=218467 RepID=UPI000C6E7C67|nr:astacin-like metalloprotease toxin 5 [Centruroides sculpturatus]
MQTISIFFFLVISTVGLNKVACEAGTKSFRDIMWEIFLKYKPMENPDLFEGDILPDDSAGESRTVVMSEARLWTDGIVPYAVDPAAKINMKLVNAVMKEFEEKTCIKFVPRKKEKNYIFIYKGRGCHSKVGMMGGRQQLSLGTGCLNKGILFHELCHALGFYHEHNRPDRDEYIEIIESNLLPNAKSQFKKYKADGIRLLTNYSYDTVMHYGSTSFSKDRSSFTMKPKKGQSVLKEVHEKSSLTENDVKYIKILYKCE